MRIKFSLFYFTWFLVLLITEILIALYLHDAIIRPYGGDFLVVILIYCFIKSFVNTPVMPTAIAVLIFSYAVEISQYFHLVNVLGWGNSSLAKILLGTSFSFTVLLMYTLGIATVLVLEHLKTSLSNF